MSGESLERIKVIIFDLDGTLVRLPINYEKIRIEITSILRRKEVSSILDALLSADEENRKISLNS